jgi:hypothetical protein
MKKAKRFLVTITLTLALGITAYGGDMHTPTAVPPPPPPPESATIDNAGAICVADTTEPGDVGSSELSFEILLALLSLF